VKVPPSQLDEHLEQELSPVYLVCGDEDLLVLEAADRIREAARRAGIDERQVFTVDGQFDWDTLRGASESLSLFSTRKLIDLRLPTGKPGRPGGEWLRDHAANAGDDVLLITSGHLTKQQLGTAWVKALDRAGVLVQCWPIDVGDLPRWLDDRMRARGLEPDAAAARLLAERVEGNLLAAAQEVDKLLVLKGSGPVSEDDIQRLVADSSRFDIFRLVDAALAGRPDRALRMARSLRAEGATPVLVCWAFARELRHVCAARRLLNEGGNVDGYMARNGVWQKRKQAIMGAMRQRPLAYWEKTLAACARLDRRIKGQEPGDPWQAIDRIAVNVGRAARR